MRNRAAILRLKPLMSTARASVTIKSSTYTLTTSPSFPHRRVLYFAVHEPKHAQRGIELGVPRPWCLPQPVQGLAQPQHLVLCSLDGEARSLLDEDRLRELDVEEC